MAAYAAFKHVEIYNVGKAKKRVLRTPGGASSDIFGSDMPQTPRTMKNRMASNIFTAEKDVALKNNGDAPRRGQKTVDSYSRLFGEPTRPITPAKNQMKSSIPFGKNMDSAQQTLPNNKGHYNGKSGSVSSASSSVSSSTENLKINGGVRSVLRSMNKGQGNQEPLDFERDPECLDSVEPSEEPSRSDDILDIDQPCLENEVGPIPPDNNIYTESDKHDVCLQSRCDTGTNSDRPYSLNNMDIAPAGLRVGGEHVGPCKDYVEQPRVPCIKIEPKDDVYSRNPITGFGLNGDGVGGLKPKKLKIREGNPVTGEGYKPGATDYIQPAGHTNGGGNQVIKNRVPPGGYSSGLCESERQT
ncbi:hypothetical protein ACLKA7_010335 [Drosophila subpalustris]